MRRALLLILLVGWVAMMVAGCAKEPAAPEPGAKKGEGLTIAVIPKGTTHVFWKSVHAGAIKAERELDGVKVIWQGPLKEDDRTGQIKVVETFTADRADGIVVAPLDDQALVRPVRQATAAGIPVVIIDSGLKDKEAYVSFVATDNYKGGQIAGQRMAELLGEKGGRVIMLRYMPGSASTMNREKGFLDELAKHPNIKLISDNQYAGATVADTRKAADALLTRFDEGEVEGIFCPNESSAYGMLQSLRGQKRAGKVFFVGFDASDMLIDAVKMGDMHGTVVQNPVRMGYEGVKTCVAHIRGEKVEKRIDTGVVLVTKDNLADPEIDKLVHPPLKEYLE